ncbi:MAG: hypothetical protein ACJ748_14930 [Flavisolibacter sp.]
MKKLLFPKKTVYYPVSSKRLPSLGACIIMDVTGSATIMIPVLGELIWAPISAIIFWKMFGFRKGFFGGIFSFIEELIPGLDFIPTFTIMWFVQYLRIKKGTTSLNLCILK